MQLIKHLRSIYRVWVHLPWLDRGIYRVLDALTDAYSYLRRYAFPPYYMRFLKLNMLWGNYEKETTALFKRIIIPGMTIIDIGAHIGYFTRIFSKHTGDKGKIYAFEADPENFILLQKNTKHLKNIELFKTAISDKAGKIDFYHSDKSGCNSIIPAEFRQKRITVSYTKLDNFIMAKGIKKVDLIKMDIEGGESTAMKGMQQLLATQNDIILVVEFNPDCLKQAQVHPVDFLKSIEYYGFIIFTITSTGLKRIDAAKLLDYNSIVSKENFVNLYCTKKAG